jgi:hypothetical protein
MTAHTTAAHTTAAHTEAQTRGHHGDRPGRAAAMTAHATEAQAGGAAGLAVDSAERLS